MNLPRQRLTPGFAALFLGAVVAASVVCGAAPPGSVPLKAPARGAVMPFTTLEAEEATVGGTARVVRMPPLPIAPTVTPEMEASGRGFVELTQTGDSVTFRVGRAANAFVLRHCIPDSPSGGGQEATLSLYVNGTFRQSLPLSSKYNWLYGKAGENGQSNDPGAGVPHVYWDESRFRIGGSALKPGDTLTLRRDTRDNATFYRVDLIDLESAPSPLPPPPPGSFLSVTDFGANGTDTVDDTQAVLACIAAAKAQNKTVWIPPGTYYQSGRFVLDGVAVRGAGVWHTAIIGDVPETGFAGSLGFTLGGSGASVRDLFIESHHLTNRSTPGGKAFIARANCTNWMVENVWIAHAHVGFWMSTVSDGMVRGCRVRGTYADAININRGSRRVVVENNHVRGAGDDGIALLSEKENTPTPAADNVVRGNTVEACWWGHNLDVAGGSGHIVENNLLADNARFGCLTINLPGAFPMYPVTSTTIRRNTILRGGGNYAYQKRGAIWLYAGSTDSQGVVLEDNDIIAPLFRALQLTGSGIQQITFVHNRIDSPGEDAIVIESSVKGSGNFTNNTIRGLRPECKPLVNKAVTAYTVTESGNSWK